MSKHLRSRLERLESRLRGQVGDRCRCAPPDFSGLTDTEVLALCEAVEATEPALVACPLCKGTTEHHRFESEHLTALYERAFGKVALQ